MADLAAIAAFTAAGLSLVTVGLTARLSSRSSHEQWRRAELRPMIARFVTTAGEMVDRCTEIATALERLDSIPESEQLTSAMREARQAVREAHDRLDLQLAEIDLIASSSVGVAAHEIAWILLEMRRANVHPPDDPVDEQRKRLNLYSATMADLVFQARVDLGIDNERQRQHFERHHRDRRAEQLPGTLDIPDANS